MRIVSGAALCVSVALALTVSTSAEARTTDIGKKTAQEIKSFCDGVAGGTFSQSPDGNSYGCASECTGGTCRVQCDKDTGCDVSIPERRVPTGSDGRLDAFVMLAPQLQTADDEGDDAFPWGLLGLFGLAGLLGLRRTADHPSTRS